MMFDQLIRDVGLDLHLGEYYFYEGTQYSKADVLDYDLELIYWACAYNVKTHPDKCSKELLEFDWFDRERNKVELTRENRSTSVFVEDLKKHNRTEIVGWTMKY